MHKIIAICINDASINIVNNKASSSFFIISISRPIIAKNGRYILDDYPSTVSSTVWM